MVSSLDASCSSAQAYLILISSACSVGVRNATAMSLVTRSPAIGMHAVCAMAPSANTAISVVPAPISTSAMPSSFSSSDSTDSLDASWCRIRSSTCRPHLATHLVTFCTALTAAVTRCTCTSRRTPDMPIGWRMPSVESMTKPLGSTCRMRWSAGMATARADSSTRSTSDSSTSESRIATAPCEWRELTCVPAMPANTEWISQSAISSASSTARWIDCSVDSISTTMPRFRPLEACEPRPITSTRPSSWTSPTIATILLVPMSRPTTSDLSGFLAMIRLRSCLLVLPGFLVLPIAGTGQLSNFHRAARQCQAVRVTQIDAVDPVKLAQVGTHAQKPFQPSRYLFPAEQQFQPAGQLKPPCAARIDRDAAYFQALRRQAGAHLLPAREDFQLMPLGSVESSQALHAAGARDLEQLAIAADQSVILPARDGLLLAHRNLQRVGPVARNRGPLHPGQCFDLGPRLLDVDGKKAAPGLLRYGRSNLGGGQPLQFTRHFQPPDRPMPGIVPATQPPDRACQGDHEKRRQQPHRYASHGAPPAVWRIRSTSWSKSRPAAAAAIGTSE